MSSNEVKSVSNSGPKSERSPAIVMTVLMVISLFLPFAQAQGSEPVDGIPVAIEDAPGINGVEKEMTFFLHYVNDSEASKTVIDKSTWYYHDTTQEWNDVDATIRVSAAQQTMKWYLYPPLAANFTVNSFDFIIWSQRIGGAGNPNNLIEIYEKDENGETLVHSKNHGAGPGITPVPSQQSYPSDAAWGGHTFKAGNSIVMLYKMNPGAGNTFDMLFDTATHDSRVVFESHDSFDIQSVYMLDHQDSLVKNLDPTATNKSLRIRANITDPLGGYDVKWVNLTLMDPIGGTLLDNVSMSKVEGTPNTYLNIYEFEWNYSGHQAGTYDMTVWAVDNNGYHHVFYYGNSDYGSYYERFDWNFSIGEISYLNVKVVDSKDVPLVGAEVVAVLNDTRVVEGTNITNASGMVNLTLFSAEYEIFVHWSDTKVANVTYILAGNVTEDSPLNITARVYYPNFRFKDGRQLSLENASVTLIYPNGTASRPFRTNETGEFDLSQVPGGSYEMFVRWRDVEVNHTTLDITNNSNHTVMAHVYYLTVKAMDNIGGTLPGAQIVIANNTTTIVFDSKVTNLTGAIISRLPAGIYDLTIYWQNSMVYEELNISFFADTIINALTGIFVLNITALDGHLVPVSKAQILVMTSSQSVVESNFTDADGTVKSRLPRGNHIVRAYWRNILVNETMIDLVDNHDITLDLDINYPTIRVVDAEGTTLPNARVDVYYPSSNKLYGTAITDEAGETGFRIPAYSYDIRVTWHDRLVNETKGLIIDSDAVITVNAWVHGLGVLVVDPHGIPVENALVETSFSNGDLVGVHMTDGNGTSSITLPADSFDIRVYWFGILVHEELGVVLDSKKDITLVVDIWYITITPVDSNGIPLEDALITLGFADSGDAFSSLSTGSSGNVTFRVPVGTYDIMVTWMEHLVFNGTGYDLNEDQDIDLECGVYYLTIIVFDSKGKMLDSSIISIQYESSLEEVATGTITQATGISLRLPSDVYRVEVSWSGVIVNITEGLELDQDRDLEIQAWVHYLTMHLVDSRDVPVIGSTISITRSTTGESLGSGTTDAQGNTSFRLPGKTPMNITAVWSGVLVLDNTGYVLETDVTETFHADVYYVQFELIDTKALPLEDAKVVLRFSENGQVMASGVTGIGGLIEFRLPAERYDVESMWFGARVHQGTMEVIGDTTSTIIVDVSYLTVVVKDSRDISLKGAWINMAFGTTGSSFGAGVTDDNGTTMSRLPHGSYTITVYWMGVRVASEPPVVLDGDMTKDVAAHVYYLDITVIDDRLIPVEDALVSVVSGSNTSLGEVVPTPSFGTVTARLPWGEYVIDVAWREIMVAQDLEVKVEEDMDLSVHARIFYLTVLAKDSTGAKLKDVQVRVEDKEGLAVGQGPTDGKGMAEFRLPVGSYTVRSRLVTTDMMTPVDTEIVKDIELTSSMEQVVSFSDYPAPVHTTNGFLVAVLSTFLLVLLALVIVLGLRRRGSAVAATDLAEYPPKDDDEEEVEDLEDEDQDEEGADDEDDVDEEGSDHEDGEDQDEGDGPHSDLKAKVEETEAPPDELDEDIMKKEVTP